MEQKWKEILGQMQPIKQGAVDAYVTNTMGVFIPKEPMDFTEVAHVHRGYEFVISFGPSVPYKVENRTVIMEGKKVFSFNPEQSHQAVDNGFRHDLIALFIEPDFLQGLAKTVYNAQAVYFDAHSNPYDTYLKTLLLTFIEESRHKQGGYDLITQSIATQVGIHILRGIKNNCPVPKKEKRYSEKRGIKQAIEFIHENYQQNFSLNDVARAAHLSPYHFSRVFKDEVGKTPFEYVLDMKIERAKELLRYRDKSITEVCFESGFTNISHFTRTFSRKVGAPPTAFRERLL